MKHAFLLSVALVATAVSAIAQQQLRRSQFVTNTYLANPAVAGTEPGTVLSSTYRNQWAGFSGGPTTMLLSGHRALPNGVGAGFVLYNDDMGGAISQTGMELTGAYSILLNNQDAVSFGLSMKGNQFEFDGTNLEVYQANDESLPGTLESSFGIDFNAGMMVYGKEESAEVLIDQLARDRDPIIRYGAMYATAMAYCGTADNNAVKRLLHVAVSDVSDDVRRAAVSCIGFVMFRSHETVPRLVTLLSESFNPHVRYGACMAVGVACAGTAFKDAIDLLSPMLEDQVDFVRQGAMMALAMVLMQASEARSPSVKKLNEHLKKVIGDKHQPPVAKIGAILATGILEAGGRNVVISLQSRAGFLRGGAVVGMMLWLQHWYWYPLMHCISLTFSATMLIGLNKNFEVPKDFKVQCKSPPSMFAYPKPVEKDEKKKLKATAVLSTTARAKAREARKEAKKSGRLSAAGSPAKSVGGDDLAPVPLERQLSNASYISTMSVDQKEGDAETVTPKKEREPSSFLLSNPDRVIPAQKRFLSILANAHYSPIAEGRDNSACTGIVVLRNNDPNAPEDVIPYHEKIAIGQADEADAPEPFEWDPNATDN